MTFIADLQIHSRYARACSKQTTLKLLEHYARIKGIHLLGTGDFQHPEWRKEIDRELTEDEHGILWSGTGFPFLWQTEISLMYSQGGKGRRVHHLLYAPNRDVATQMTDALGRKGRLDYDGRPIFGFSSIELVDMMRSISPDIEIIPAHCLLPGTLIHANPRLEAIDNLKIGEKVLTHKGRYKEVKQIYSRKYNGAVYIIKPRYFTLGLTTTDEHPFFAIRTLKNCSRSSGICKPGKLHAKRCVTHAHQDYRSQWIMAKDLEVGDVLLYPRSKEVVDVKTFDYKGMSIKVDKEFCRLIGYYLAEGYPNSRDGIGFSFNKNEKDFVNDVQSLLSHTFGLRTKKGKTEGDLVAYSKQIMYFFMDLFYINSQKRAPSKILPSWMLLLPLDKQVEIFKGWWYGDRGSTSSRVLANQMKTICLRLGIAPSIRVDTCEEHTARGKHMIKSRIIRANSDNYVLGRLTFFEDPFELQTDRYFAKFKKLRDKTYGWMDANYLYAPIFKIQRGRYDGLVYNLEVDEDNSYVSEFATIHNCWTPWFSVFGSKSGFDSLQECFQDRARYIHAVETGMSSDPAMNWRISALDPIQLVSFSDAHSYWPWRLGREATLFDCKMKYKDILHAVRTGEGLVGTIEVQPHYGKYHFDGHRNCGVVLPPLETKKLEGLCPKCKNPLTIGVQYRVDQLADRPEGYVKKDGKPFKSSIPLSEILAMVLKSGIATKKVWTMYHALITAFGNEYAVLFDADLENIGARTHPTVAKIIGSSRQGKLLIEPGYDGVYGRPVLEGADLQRLSDEPTTIVSSARSEQKSLKDF